MVAREKRKLGPPIVPLLSRSFKSVLEFNTKSPPIERVPPLKEKAEPLLKVKLDPMDKLIHVSVRSKIINKTIENRT